MDITTEILRESLENKKALAFYSNKNETSDFYVGIVISHFSDSMLIKSYDNDATSDGYILIRLCDLFRIEKDTNYLNLLNERIDSNLQIEHQTQISITNYDESGFDIILDYLKRNERLMSIQLIYDVYITGFIDKYDEENLIMKIYKEDGSFDGYSLVKMEDIQGIAFDRKKEGAINKLIDLINNV